MPSCNSTLTLLSCHSTLIAARHGSALFLQPQLNLLYAVSELQSMVCVVILQDLQLKPKSSSKKCGKAARP